MGTKTWERGVNLLGLSPTYPTDRNGPRTLSRQSAVIPFNHHRIPNEDCSTRFSSPTGFSDSRKEYYTYFYGSLL